MSTRKPLGSDFDIIPIILPLDLQTARSGDYISLAVNSDRTGSNAQLGWVLALVQPRRQGAPDALQSSIA